MSSSTEDSTKFLKSRKRPTMVDVAELAGVSRTTVSYVINHKAGGNIRISDETREKVWEAVEALNYRPMSAARTLRTQRSHLLVQMVPFIETTFHPMFAAAIQGEAERANMDVIIYDSRNDPEREKEFLEHCLSRGVDGIIAQTYHLTADDLNRLIEAGVAVVIHGDVPVHPFADNVVFDETAASQELVSHLVEKGYQLIATIAGPSHTWPGRLRRDGYEKALQFHGLSLDERLICEAGAYTRNWGARCMEQLMRLPEPPTAVFAANDVLAAGALLFAQDTGLSVPEDVAIVGFDDTTEAVLVRPQLTTVHKDVHQLGKKAVEMLLERTNNSNILPARQVVLDYDIVYRDSC